MSPPEATHSAERPLAGTSGWANMAQGQSEAEEWRPVLGYEDLYEVSSTGHVARRGQVRQLALPQTYWGAYLAVTLRGRGRPRRARVHVLVLEAFIGPRPKGMVARHLNDQQSDNRLENLAWGTPEQNREDARRNRNTVTWSEFHAGRKGSNR